MTEQQAKELLTRYRNGSCTEAERKMVESWVESELDTRRWDMSAEDRLLFGQQLKTRIDEEKAASVPAVLSRKKQASIYRYAAAAVILIALSLGIYFYLVDYSNLKSEIVNLKSDDIDPGGNRAILTLADGRKIVLDEAANGELAEESGIKITKTADGQLVYEVLRHAPQARASESRIADARQPTAGSAGWRASVMRDPATYNTIETPKGGQYKIILPDSSVVWLNAASSLKYPTRFSGAERRVELTGEAYFQISSKYQVEEKRRSRDIGDASIKTASAQAVGDTNKSKIVNRISKIPFIVVTATQEVTVLGTQFNINAYKDESMVKTTLVEGSVRVASTSAQSTNLPIHKSTILLPNEQSTLAGSSLAKAKVEVSDYVAWKDGLIVLHRADLQQVLRQIERWYDVEFVHAENLKVSGTLSGEVPRNIKLSGVLAALEEQCNAQFEIKGRRIMVK